MNTMVFGFEKTGERVPKIIYETREKRARLGMVAAREIVNAAIKSASGGISKRIDLPSICTHIAQKNVGAASDSRSMSFIASPRKCTKAAR